MPNSDLGEDERQDRAAAPCAQGWEVVGQLRRGRDARIPQLLWQAVISARGQGVCTRGHPWRAAGCREGLPRGNGAGGTCSRERCDGEGCGGYWRHWWLWSWDWRGDLGALERKFWRGEGGEGCPLVGRGQARWSGAKKLQGNLWLVKSPKDGNTKPDPGHRVLARGGAAVRGWYLATSGGRWGGDPCPTEKASCVTEPEQRI